MVKINQNVFPAPIRIRFRGTYDFDGLLSLIRDFYGRHRFDLFENKFKFKTGGSGAEVEIGFEGEKDVTHYLRVHMKIDGKLFDVKRRKEVIDGVNKTVTDGRLIFWISGDWVIDYRGRFAQKNSGKTQKKLEKWMQKFLDNEPEGLEYMDLKYSGKDYMVKTLNSFADEIKTFLGMETMK